ncbi:hypothetical protein IW140_002009 [Coemansia sp. RSA 1813]|nr:hypothetical protein LPJ74_000418 [Coemansia sp. RSA 1843]KAJ1773513.1 hypothetical protein LPJ74_000427 [Coemansia sp. RSA 1843]KAJ2216392.1 hypothetical protein EV179_001419 [Coemansia sp. RSA 487]KAJ2570822.1 hypothetical protein IW140_002009 [Coemansia sp. RSA 1813]
MSTFSVDFDFLSLLLQSPDMNQNQQCFNEAPKTLLESLPSLSSSTQLQPKSQLPLLGMSDMVPSVAQSDLFLAGSNTSDKALFGRGLSEPSGMDKKAVFPFSLHRIASDPANSDWVMWNREGNAIRYSDPQKLLAAMQAHGHTARSDSIIAKGIADYGFVRHTDGRRTGRAKILGKQWVVVSHPLMKLGDAYSASQITRRKKGHGRRGSAIVPLSPQQDQW